MNWKFIKWYQAILFTLFLACAPDRDEFISYNMNTNTKLEIADQEGLSFENSSITDGTEFNFKTQTAGKYTLEIRDHFKTLISKSIIDAQVGDNVMKFYTRALQNSDYTIIIKKDGKIKYNVKYNVQ
tara:strand:- start:263 stop:643 length:381 start_codon:yes stop_codon:yes gene_type:complete